MLYSNIDAMVAALAPTYPVMCFRPQQIERAARAFLTQFPGRVLYAVKCNPHVTVLEALHRAGIRHFDTASIPELALIAQSLDNAQCYFNHTVKSRPAIETAYRQYGVRDFVVDHLGELAKVEQHAGRDATVQVRLATPPAFAAFDLSTKFGAGEDEAVELLRAVHALGHAAALSFHVGSQCRDPQAYATAIKLAARVVRAAAVPITYLNVGGGFPAPYGDGELPPLRTFLKTIRDSIRDYGLDGVDLLCEPGRALVAEGASLVVQVLLRKEDRIYVNDGIFGCLSELHYGGLKPPARPIRLDGGFAGDLRPFQAFGPTCDSTDVFPHPMMLPADIREGDWIEIGDVGAYSNALATRFNGFDTDTFVTIEEEMPAIAAGA
jgi:ornithine decarboxylase